LGAFRDIRGRASRDLSKNSDGAPDFLDIQQIRPTFFPMASGTLARLNGLAQQMQVWEVESVHRKRSKEERVKVQKLVHSFGALFILASVFVIGPKAVSAQSPDSEEISQLLIAAKSHAIEAEYDADTLDTYTKSKISWEGHANQLGLIREHINALGKVDKSLRDLRATGSPWQQKAIDQIHPLLVEMADLLRTTIRHFSENPKGIHMPVYRDYAHANYEVATRLAGMIRNYVEYDEAQSKIAALEAKLGTAASEKSD